MPEQPSPGTRFSSSQRSSALSTPSPQNSVTQPSSGHSSPVVDASPSRLELGSEETSSKPPSVDSPSPVEPGSAESPSVRSIPVSALAGSSEPQPIGRIRYRKVVSATRKPPGFRPNPARSSNISRLRYILRESFVT